MITRQELIDACAVLLDDFQNGTADLDRVAECPAIAELLERLPADGERPTTMPLTATVKPANLGAYVGYQFMMNSPLYGRESVAPVTIAAVHVTDDGNAQVELAEYPGHHIVRTEPTPVVAPRGGVKPALPVPTEPKRINLIDRENDLWVDLGDGRYLYADGPQLTRLQVERSYGPVRDESELAAARQELDTHRAVLPANSERPATLPLKRVDLIDSDGDRWWDVGDGWYASSSPRSREDIERNYGPVRDAD